MASSEDTDVLVSQDDFDRAFRDLVPSVSQSEMDHYANIQQRFSGAKAEDNSLLQSQGEAITGGHTV